MIYLEWVVVLENSKHCGLGKHVLIIVGSNSSPYGENNLSFDPESPHAFTPPDYDSLPKDPPKYADICSVDQGLTPADPDPVAEPESVEPPSLPDPPPEYSQSDPAQNNNHHSHDTCTDNGGNPASQQHCDVMENRQAGVTAVTSGCENVCNSSFDSPSEVTGDLNRHVASGGDGPVYSVVDEQSQSNSEQRQIETGNSSSANDVTTEIRIGESLSESS